ncbi:hypothetical protein BJ944DRAFT_160922 [Cunninghamella echinulata]|nr:hypothetical protein BJ944DRAFT_160922 [Cunninghamella echinulata]
MSEPQFLIHQETYDFMTEPIYFQIIQMEKSYFIWVGKSSGKMGNLTMSVPTFGSQSIPSATNILGHDIKEFSQNLARPLKYGEQFYISLDLSSQDDMLNAFVEKKLNDFIKKSIA